MREKRPPRVREARAQDEREADAHGEGRKRQGGRQGERLAFVMLLIVAEPSWNRKETPSFAQRPCTACGNRRLGSARRGRGGDGVWNGVVRGTAADRVGGAPLDDPLVGAPHQLREVAHPPAAAEVALDGRQEQRPHELHRLRRAPLKGGLNSSNRVGAASAQRTFLMAGSSGR